MLMKLLYIDEEKVIVNAAFELKRILEQMDSNLEIALCGMPQKSPSKGFWLGTFDAMGLDSPPVNQKKFDDAYFIDTEGVEGIIAGTNSRSVLLGVYRYLRELGCAWVRPGDKGEVIPRTSLAGSSIKLNESASFRHRGVCIEGAVNYDHVNEMVSWLPKIGMNAYFNQFWTPYTFYDRWYNHIDNPKLKPEPVTVEEVDGFVQSQLVSIRNNGMLYHATGHGWTCAPFGLDSLGWYPYEGELPDEVEELLAQVKGKRELHDGIPLNTNLCYSNPIVRQKMISAIINYCEQNKDVDFLHFWLADAMNCHCECENCIKKRPSDNYVDLLNELDEQMTKAGVPTRVVFLIYFDLLWSPVSSRIKNPDRFVLQFAPISRTYSASYMQSVPSDSIEEPHPFAYNELQLPRSVDENLVYLRGWQKHFEGDSFVFDYHLWRDHLRDVGYAQISKVLFQDMQGLKRLGLNGMMSCQAQRVFSPSALPMLLMADALWDENADYETCVQKHYQQMYGESWLKVREYLEGISMLFDSSYLRQEKKPVDSDVQRGFEQAEMLVRNFQPFIQSKLDEEAPMHPAVRHSYFILKHHAELSLLLAKALQYKAAGENERVKPAWEKAAEYAQVNELALKDEFDVYEFINVIGGSITRTEWEWQQ